MKRGEGLLKTVESQSQNFKHKLHKSSSSISSKIPPKIQNLIKNPQNQTQSPGPDKSAIEVDLEESKRSLEIKEASKLANLPKFFIVFSKQEKISQIGSRLKENELRMLIEQERLGMKAKVNTLARKNSIRMPDELKESKGFKQPQFITDTEKKMMEIDREIVENIEVNREFQRKLTFFQSLKNHVDEEKQEKKVQSKIKSLMRIDPVYLVFMPKRKNVDDELIKERIQKLGHKRSISLGAFRSGKKTPEKEFHEQGKNEVRVASMRKVPSVALKDFSKLTRQSLHEFRKIQKNLRSAFKKQE